ncbi:MAG: MlaD family protein [Planctomycetota bacterium]|jgi:paraquat-inducible protein B
MARKANPTVIGGFVVGAAALAVIAVFVFGSGRLFADTVTYVMYFDGSVKGLNVGAPVTFRGVQIGSVTDIKLVADVEDLSMRIPVLIEIERDKFVRVRGGKPVPTAAVQDPRLMLRRLTKRGLRGQLQTRSFVTGMLMVALDFFGEEDEEIELTGTDTRYPEIPTVPSSMEELSRTVENLPLQEITEAFLSAVEAIDRIAEMPELADMIRSADEALEEIEGLVQSANASLVSLSERTEQLLEHTDQLVQNADSRVSSVATSVEEAMGSARELVKDVDTQVEPVTAELMAASEAARAALEQATETLSAAEGLAGDDPAVRHVITSALRELAAAARSIRTVAEYLERHPEALIRGKGGE